MKNNVISLQRLISIGNKHSIKDYVTNSSLLSQDDYIKAAESLRNLMEYHDAIEVCELCMKNYPDSVKARELKAQALGRISPNNFEQAAQLLQEAMRLPSTEKNESASLLARLSKELWRMEWFASEKTVESTRSLARTKKDELFAAIEGYRTAASKENNYYPCVNAVSLMVVAQDLDLVLPEDQASWNQTIHELRAIAFPLIEQDINKGGHDAYWALASRAEFSLLNPSTEKSKISVIDDIRLGIEHAGPNPFLLDSTTQQFKMFNKLGIGDTNYLHQVLTILNRTRDCLLKPRPPVPETTGIPEWVNKLLKLAAKTPDYQGELIQKDKDPLFLNFLGSLRIRFEPIEKIIPGYSEGTLLGFEMLAGDALGRTYPMIKEAAQALGMKNEDFYLALFALGLHTANQLSTCLNTSQRTEKLFFSINLDPLSLQHPLFKPLLREQYSDESKQIIFVELNEDFPVPPKKKLHGFVEERNYIVEQCQALATDLRNLQLRLVFDDCNELDLVARLELQELCTKAKVDFKYTSHVMNICWNKSNREKTIPRELSRFKALDKPFIIEGIEEDDWYYFLKTPSVVAHWDTDTSMQGWYIKIHDPNINRYFVPINPGSKPGGYYLSTGI